MRLSDIKPEDITGGFFERNDGKVYEFQSIEVVDDKWEITVKEVSDSPTG